MDRILHGRFAVTKDFDTLTYTLHLMFWTQKDEKEGTVHDLGIRIPQEQMRAIHDITADEVAFVPFERMSVVDRTKPTPDYLK